MATENKFWRTRRAVAPVGRDVRVRRGFGRERFAKRQAVVEARGRGRVGGGRRTGMAEAEGTTCGARGPSPSACELADTIYSATSISTGVAVTSKLQPASRRLANQMGANKRNANAQKLTSTLIDYNGCALSWFL